MLISTHPLAEHAKAVEESSVKKTPTVKKSKTAIAPAIAQEAAKNDLNASTIDSFFMKKTPTAAAQENPEASAGVVQALAAPHCGLVAIVGNPNSKANWCSVSCLTKFARTRDISPSAIVSSALYSKPDTARLSTESPKNSNRSLWSDVKLRCVSARANSDCCLKVYCNRS